MTTTGRNIIITGAAGFIGLHLTRAHLSLGDTVLALDNFTTGRLTVLRRLTLGDDYHRLTIRPHDVALPYHDTLDGPVDVIYNLASPASPPAYQRDPIATWKTNTLGALHAATAAQITGATLIQASTSEIYGDPTQHPQTEDYPGNTPTIGPRACYDESKRAAETLLADHARTQGTHTRIARIFNTYGPGMPPTDGRVITNLVTQALTPDTHLTIYGDGTQTRSFTYITDTIRGLMLLANAPDTLDGIPINIGSPTETTITDLAHLILRLTDSSNPLEYHPLPTHDPIRRRPDITRASALLDWAPRVTLEDGLTQTITYLRLALGRRATL